MTSKFIIIGDSHIMLSNLRDVDLLLSRLVVLIEEEKPDFIVMLGDILNNHEKIHTISLNKACDFIDKLREFCKVFVLVGNHDAINHSQFLNTNHWMNSLKEWDNVCIVDKIVSLNHEDKLFMFVPYVANGRFIEALETSNDDFKEASCIFAHQEFKGCKMGMIISENGDDWPKDYPSVISGHIHSNQTIDNVYYSGSMLQHAFGESEKNIIAIVEFSESQLEPYSLKEVDLKLPRKKIIYKDMEDLDDYEMKETEDKVKLTLSGNYEQFKAFKKTKKYKDIVKKNIKVVFKTKKIDTDNIPSVENESDFKDILTKLVEHAKDPYLSQVHEQLMNGRNISAEDIMYI